MQTDNPFALFWAWTEPHSAAGEKAGNSTEERPSVWRGGDDLLPETRVIPFPRREP